MADPKRYPQSELKPALNTPGLCIDFALPAGEYGDRPVLVEKDALCGDCGKRHDMEKCPKCGSWITLGFGLMGGGFGPYAFCNEDNGPCDWFWKEALPDDEA